MHFKARLEDGTTVTVGGRDAFPVIRRAFRYMSQQILVPAPPHTTKVRARAAAALRRGEAVSDGWDDDGQPAGNMILKKLGD
jgi:hypothetical protein